MNAHFVKFMLLCTLLLTLMASSSQPIVQANPAAPNLAAMPLMFIEQQPNRYQVQLNGQSMWFTQDSMWLTTKEENIKLTFQAANPQARIEPINKLETHLSYFKGNDPAKWQTDIPVYSGVRYHDLYPNTDLIITSEQGKLAWRMENYNEEVNVANFRFIHQFAVVVDNGTTPQTLTLDPNQSLTNQLAAIISPQTQTANTNPHLPRQQESTGLIWSTFLGGTGYDYGKAMAVDSTGNVYLTGSTNSSDFPTTAGAFDTSHNNIVNADGQLGSDVFVAKLNSTGTALIYATFLGGSYNDMGNAIAVDSTGNAYVTGQTGSGNNTISNNFPTTAGAFNTSYNGGWYDVFVAKLNSNGTALSYATYLGGSDSDVGQAIAVDSTGNVYLTGYTSSTNFPTTAGAFDTSYNQLTERLTRDVFVAKLNSSGTALSYATFLGSADEGRAIAIDSTGNAYLTGQIGFNQATGGDFPTTAGAFDTRFDGDLTDGFVAKLNSSGTALIYATFLGGYDYDWGNAIAVDSTGNAYVTGHTRSSNFPTTAGAFNTSYIGYPNAFVVKLNSSGTALIYATYLDSEDEGRAADEGRAIAVDSTGNAYVMADFTNKYSQSFGFVSKLNSNGTALIYATDFDGKGNAMAIDSTGNAYVAVNAINNGGDVFVSKLSMIPIPTTPTPIAGTATPTPQPTTPVAGTATPTSPSTTPTPQSTAMPVPNRPTQSRQVGNITVYADSFSGSSPSWQANGTVWLGDYTIVENATLNYDGSNLTGKGLVSMVATQNGQQRVSLFADSFKVAGAVLTPQMTAFDFRLKDLVGFRIENPPTQITLDLAQGQFKTTLNLAVIIPANKVVKAIEVTFSHTGAVSGSFQGLSFALGKVQLEVAQATLSAEGITLNKAKLVMPASLGGTKADLSISATISRDGKFSLAEGQAHFNFPNLKVGGKNGFAIEGAEASLSYEDGGYLFSGAGTFVLPGVGSGESSCKVGTGFTLANTPPPIREATLSIEGCFKIPIGQSGFFLTGVSGKVALDETSVAIDVGITVEGGPDVPGLGVAISGSPQAHWDNSWAIGLKGTLKVFTFDVAEAALTLSQKKGLEGKINISLLGVIDGEGNLHVWYDKSKFHLTGSQEVRLSVIKGKMFEKCTLLGCIYFPPSTFQSPAVKADFGEFQHAGQTIYGLKGQVSYDRMSYAYFVNAQNGDLAIGYDLAEYEPAQSKLVKTGQRSSSLQEFVIVNQPAALIVGLASASGSPTLTLKTPSGQILDSSNPNVVVSTVLTQTLFSLANPESGTWQVTVNNILNNEPYIVAVLGAKPPATITPPTVKANVDGSYSLNFIGQSNTPTSTISLFYDTSAISHTGQPIVSNLPLTTTTYTWQPDAVLAGSYFIYAMVDDPLGAPVYAYSASAINLTDTTPPDAPTNLSVTPNENSALITWQPSQAKDVTGYTLYLSEPNNGVTQMTDIPNGQQSRYTQLGLYLDGGWQVAISAYDINGNESSRSSLVTAQIGTATTGKIYLPLIRK